MSTAPSLSDAQIIPFPLQPEWTESEFARNREAWHRQVMADTGCDPAANKVAGILLWHLNRKTRACFLLNKTIAKATGLSERHVRRGLSKLVEQKHLRREERAGRSSILYPIIGVADTQHDPGLTCPPSPHTPVSHVPTPRSHMSSITSLREPKSKEGSQDPAFGGGDPCSQGGADSKSPQPSGALKNGSEVTFDGEVVRPDSRALERWRRDYPAIPDLMAELRKADDYFVDKPIEGDDRWFWRTSKWLARANDQYRQHKIAAEIDEDSF